MPDNSLDGRSFAMVSSTASRVDPDEPTVFHYHEADGLLWGDYCGDTVSRGHFVGRREGAQVHISFGHIMAGSGTVVTGSAISTVRVSRSGTLELVEAFGDQGQHTSVCREIANAPA